MTAARKIHVAKLLSAIAIFIIIVALTTLPACRQSTNDPFAEARLQIKRFMQEKNIASFQIALAKDGKIIFQEAFGLANAQEQIPATNKTMYLVASIDKPIISTALMMLAERGKIDLHEPINTYLGNEKLVAYQGNASDATVARLLLHVSGMAYGYYICNDSFPIQQRRSNSDLLKLAGVLVYPPGKVYEYTNYGYGLLDDIAEKAAGGNLKEYIMKEIFAPLGLKHTRYFRSQPSKELIATQNVKEGTLPFFLNFNGYSGLYSTAGDLARFGMFHLKNHLYGKQQILSDSSIDLLQTYQEPGIQFTTRTLAWDIQEDYGYNIVMHGGGGPGIHNYLYMIPSENLVIAYLSNAQYASSTPILLELLYAALPRFNLWNKLQGRGWPDWPKINPNKWEGEWKGRISGLKGTCPITMIFNRTGIPKIHIEDGSNTESWIMPNTEVQHNYGKVCYRFNACIPYLLPYAQHDEIVFILKPLGNLLIGSASAAKEKYFGKGENYVLPQYVELTRMRDQ
jgi:CubicO group peptidase (beta-lactamase class C family)